VKYDTKEELNQILKSQKKKHYSKKNEWERFLEKDRIRWSRSEKRRIMHETSLEALIERELKQDDDSGN
jgi:hypothetical protein